MEDVREALTILLPCLFQDVGETIHKRKSYSSLIPEGSAGPQPRPVHDRLLSLLPPIMALPIADRNARMATPIPTTTLFPFR